MSETPRSDAQHFVSDINNRGSEVVQYDFARQLERELALVNERREQLRAELHQANDQVSSMREIVRDCCHKQLPQLRQELNEARSSLTEESRRYHELAGLVEKVRMERDKYLTRIQMVEEYKIGDEFLKQRDQWRKCAEDAVHALSEISFHKTDTEGLFRAFATHHVETIKAVVASFNELKGPK